MPIASPKSVLLTNVEILQDTTHSSLAELYLLDVLCHPGEEKQKIVMSNTGLGRVEEKIFFLSTADYSQVVKLSQRCSFCLNLLTTKA